MELLISVSDVRAYGINLPLDIKDLQYNLYIQDAQENFLKPFIGDDFYYDVLFNKNQSNYIELIKGGMYNNNGSTNYHNGIGYPIALYSFAYFTEFSQLQMASNGVSRINNDFSENVPNDDKLIKDAVNFYKNKAQMALTIEERFLNANTFNFPLWKTEEKSLNEKSKVNIYFI